MALLKLDAIDRKLLERLQLDSTTQVAGSRRSGVRSSLSLLSVVTTVASGVMRRSRYSNDA
ncbi:MAG TPA: hypothetical protein VN201_07510, partial [Roseateles sp.]|nr:hypothetical protein [Roseateles sp.]